MDPLRRLGAPGSGAPAPGRRRFLARLLRLLVASSSPGPVFGAAASALQGCARPLPVAGLDADAWRTLAAVHDHLLPSEPGAPGAREVNATGYLRRVLADPRLRPEERELVRAGVRDLERLCDARFGARFAALGEDRREAALREFERTSGGGRWLGEMLDFLLEALLGDPSHGGNPGGVGWRWLGVTPGFPRPPAGGEGA